MGVILDWIGRFKNGGGIDRNVSGTPGVDTEFPPLTNDVHNHRVSHWNEMAAAVIKLQEIVTQGPIWNYMDGTKPAGVTADPLYWQFDGSGSQKDERRLGLANLTLFSGTEFSIPYPVSGGSLFLGLSENERYTSSHSSLQIAGEATFEAVCTLAEITGSDDVLYGWSAAGETEATNYLYRHEILNGSAHFNWFTESGAGVNSSLVFDGAMMPVGPIQHVVFTRNAAGLVSLYQNGVFMQSFAATLPTGGGSGGFTLGTEHDGSEPYHGAIQGLRIWDGQEFTAAQVLESYQRIRGQIP